MPRMKPTVVLREDGSLGTSRVFHTHSDCRFVREAVKDTASSLKEVDADFVKVVGLRECSGCERLNQPFDPQLAVAGGTTDVLRRTIRLAVTELGQGDVQSARKILEDGLQSSYTTPGPTEESSG